MANAPHGRMVAAFNCTSTPRPAGPKGIYTVCTVWSTCTRYGWEGRHERNTNHYLSKTIRIGESGYGRLIEMRSVSKFDLPKRLQAGFPPRMGPIQCYTMWVTMG